METWALANRFAQAPSSRQTSLNRPSVVPRGMNDSKLSKTDATTIVEHEMQQVERANATGRPPVVFIHGLWLLPSSWDRWAKVFEDAGYATLSATRLMRMRLRSCTRSSPCLLLAKRSSSPEQPTSTPGLRQRSRRIQNEDPC